MSSGGAGPSVGVKTPNSSTHLNVNSYMPSGDAVQFALAAGAHIQEQTPCMNKEADYPT